MPDFLDEYIESDSKRWLVYKKICRQHIKVITLKNLPGFLYPAFFVFVPFWLIMIPFLSLMDLKDDLRKYEELARKRIENL